MKNTQQTEMHRDAAETGDLQALLAQVGTALDQFLRFEHADPVRTSHEWRPRLDTALPLQGIGIEQVTDELITYLIPNGSPVAKPGFTSFITTGGTTASTLASTAASIAAPQRYLLTAFNFLEELSLGWLASMCSIGHLQGVYSSGGSVANLLALGAARQHAFEKVG
ncbi:MAG: pyridoxal-dependent decarboxylase, partial [Candidatus Competibacteraceae bacterium]|nr:pyridoxal-dependent decarboxylase [Candidatus Competibacteraceae bacterium]